MVRSQDRFKQISKELGLLRNDIKEVKARLQNLVSLDVETYEVKPDYIRKIEKIEKKGKFISFKNVEALRKEIENV